MVKEGYKMTEVGVIPEEWEVVELPKVIWFQEGPGLRKWQFTDKGIKVINVTNLQHNGTLDLSLTNRHISIQEFESQYRHFEVDDGDIVMASSGNSYGKVSKVRQVDLPLVMNTSVIRFKPLQAMDGSFMYSFLKSPNFINQIDLMITGGAQPNFGPFHLEKIQIPLPPTLHEQRAIATALSDTDALLAALDALIGKKEAFKRGMMEGLLSGAMRLEGFSGEWEETTFDQVMIGFSSGATPRRNVAEYYEGDIPWITSSELNYNVITDTTERITEEAVTKTNLSWLEPGTFLIAITGLEAAGTRGSCGIVGIRSTSNQSCMALIPIPDRLDLEYLFQYYSFYGDQLALEYCQGTKQQSYTGKIVKILPMKLPKELPEQRAIAAVLSDLDAELSALRARRAKLGLVKAGMMEALLGGGVRLV